MTARRACSVLAFVMLLVPIPAARAGNQDAQGQDGIGVYHSEEFDVVVWWDAALWTVANQVTEVGYGFLRVEAPEGAVFFEMYEQPGMTEADCLDRSLSELRGDGAVSDITYLGGAGTFEFDYRFDDGTVGRFAKTGRCTFIRDGQAVVRAVTLHPAGAEFGVTSVLWKQSERIAFLRGAWPPLDPAPSPGPEWSTVPTILGRLWLDDLFGDYGTPPEAAATVTLRLIGRLDEAAVRAAHLPDLGQGRHYAELTADFASDPGMPASIVIGPDRFYLQDPFSFVYLPVHWMWDGGTILDAPSHLELAPGELARLNIYFELPNDVRLSNLRCHCRLAYQAWPLSLGDDWQQIGPSISWPPYQLAPGLSSLTRLFDRRGDETALVIRLASVDTDAFSRQLLLIENTGTETMIVDPGHFQSQSGILDDPAEGEALRLTPIRSYTWLYGTATDRGAQELAPGGIAIVAVETELNHDLYYFADRDAPVDVG